MRIAELGPNGQAMADAVQACVHCGFCLPTCPTYQLSQEEMDSPRGRIYLMKSVLEGELALEEALPHVDQCLGCLACETACPSGVEYRNLLMPFRERAGQKREQPWLVRLRRLLMLQTLPHPRRFRWAIGVGRVGARLPGLVPKVLRPMLELLPRKLPPACSLPAFTPAKGTKRGRVALLAGCAQQVLDPQINVATIDVLSRNGVEVLCPAEQACCGALAWHVGARKSAQRTGRANLAAFDVGDVDAVVTNAAGCGSGMHEYPLIFEGTAEQEQARRLAEKVLDITTYLDQLGIATPPPLAQPVTAAYHDACHLLHGQGVADGPRRLLGQIGNLTLVELNDGGRCCGSAGTYNIEQPGNARELGELKAQTIVRTKAQVLVTGNIGGMVQIRKYLPATMPILHTVQMLERAYTGRSLTE
jgi:glycolate oxidase iron-sulfur subunit